MKNFFSSMICLLFFGVICAIFIPNYNIDKTQEVQEKIIEDSITNDFKIELVDEFSKITIQLEEKFNKIA